MKKRVICFGDSNTWGYNAASAERFEEHERWTGLLQEELGAEYTIIEEGLSGRTTVWDDPIEQDKNGYKHLFTVMESQKPFDLIIIMLGTNDLKSRFSVTAFDIAQSAALLVREAMRSQCGRDGKPPKVLLAAPIKVGPDIVDHWLGGFFPPDSITRSQKFDNLYSEIAVELGCYYLNAGEYTDPDPLDSLHIPPEGQKPLALAMAEKVKSIIG